MVDKINLDDWQRQIDKRQLRECKPDEPRQQLDEEAGWNVWETMTKLFHHAWTSREGEEPTEHWVQLLTEFTPAQIDSGFNKLLSWDSDFPPTALQFRKMCLPATISPNGGNSGAYIIYKPEKLIEDRGYVAKRKKAGKSALNAMKGLFK